MKKLSYVIFPVWVGFLFLVFAGCGVSKKEYQIKSDEVEKLKAENSSIKTTIESDKLELEKLKSENASLKTTANASKEELSKKIQELETIAKTKDDEIQKIKLAKEEEIKKVKSTYDNLVNDLQSEIKSGEIQITQLQDKLSVNMVDKILFDSGEANVKLEGKKVLDKVGMILKKIKNKQIRIEGHTDNVPIIGIEKFPTNWELSSARATNVARYLQEKTGVNPSMLVVAGYGEFRPIADNKTVEGRAKNRRIEIVLVPIDIDRVTSTEIKETTGTVKPKKP